MMVTRAEAVGTVNNIVADAKSSELSDKKVREALIAARQLEPSERQIAISQLATALWLRSLSKGGPFYPGFEAFLQSRFATRKSFEQQIRQLVTEASVGADARVLYCEYLGKMFQSSGKTRNQFYSEMLAEMAMQVSLESVDFGEKAVQFYESVTETLHQEHLLVFYSVGLLLKVFKKRHPNSRTPLTEEEVEAMYEYFEKSLPLSERFMEYAIDESLLDYNFGGERLFQIN